MNTARSALNHSHLSDSYWALAVVDATYKYNCMPHASTKQTPIRLWQPQAQLPPYLIPFGTLGTISIREPNKKLQPRAKLVRSMLHVDQAHIRIGTIESATITHSRLHDFKSTHPASDPSTHLASALKSLHQNPKIPAEITNTTPPPRTTAISER